MKLGFYSINMLLYFLHVHCTSHLAEVRVKQQNAARTKLESQIEDLPSRPTFLTNTGERLVF